MSKKYRTLSVDFMVEEDGFDMEDLSRKMSKFIERETGEWEAIITEVTDEIHCSACLELRDAARRVRDFLQCRR